MKPVQRETVELVVRRTASGTWIVLAAGGVLLGIIHEGSEGFRVRHSNGAQGPARKSLEAALREFKTGA